MVAEPRREVSPEAALQEESRQEGPEARREVILLAGQPPTRLDDECENQAGQFRKEPFS